MLGIHNSFKAFLVLCLSSKHCSLRRRRIWRHLQLALPERHRLLRLIIVVVVAAAPLFIRIQSFRCIIISFLSVCVTFLYFLLFVCCANGRSVKYDYTSTSSTRVSWWTIHWQCIRSMCVSVIRSVAAALSLSLTHKKEQSDLAMSDANFSSCHFNSFQLLHVELANGGREVKWQSLSRHPRLGGSGRRLVSVDLSREDLWTSLFISGYLHAYIIDDCFWPFVLSASFAAYRLHQRLGNSGEMTKASDLSNNALWLPLVICFLSRWCCCSSSSLFFSQQPNASILVR